MTSIHSAADVAAEAAMPLRISNGSTGALGVTGLCTSRADMRAQAAAAPRAGHISRGEIGLM